MNCLPVHFSDNFVISLSIIEHNSSNFLHWKLKLQYDVNWLKYFCIFLQKACTRIFWKSEPNGQFNRDHQSVLVKNNWDHLAQEVLISTPRRFGKTISVSMFAAAMLYSAPSVEISIYSTCKRISQKLLRNVVKFINEMCNNNLEENGFRVIRQNMEEIVLQGTGGFGDQRVVNSYPSKVSQSVIKSQFYKSQI